MNSGNSVDPASGIGIAALERDIGVGKETLRVWERRYGFPQPLRDAFGQLAIKLRINPDLLGWRP